MIKYKRGNIIEDFEENKVNFILHQTNCVSGADVAGFAKSLTIKYPQLQQALDKDCNKVTLGGFRFTHIETYKSIVNIYSQYYPGAPSNDTFYNSNIGYKLTDCFFNRVKALNEVLSKLENIFSNLSKEHIIGMPLIASGLAADKGRKDTGIGELSDLEYFKKYIEPEVNKYFKEREIIVYYL